MKIEDDDDDNDNDIDIDMRDACIAKLWQHRAALAIATLPRPSSTAMIHRQLIPDYDSNKIMYYSSVVERQYQRSKSSA